METKPTGLARLRSMFKRSPAIEQNNASDTIQPHLEAIVDQARNICPDPWLANQINLSVKNEGGKMLFSVTPNEGLQYIIAARSILAEKVPAEVSGPFDAMVASKRNQAS